MSGSRYQTVKLYLNDLNKKKLKKATNKSSQVTLNFSYEDLMHEAQGEIALTKTQIKKLVKAVNQSSGTSITLSKAQILFNHKKIGGFLPFLAPIIAAISSAATAAAPVLTSTVLPAVATGALGAVGSKIVDAVTGNGLYLKTGGCVCRVETDGHGLYLSPISKSDFNGKSKMGSGLYLKRQGGTIQTRSDLLDHTQQILDCQRIEQRSNPCNRSKVIQHFEMLNSGFTLL